MPWHTRACALLVTLMMFSGVAYAWTAKYPLPADWKMTAQSDKAIIWIVKTPEEINAKVPGALGLAWVGVMGGNCVIWTPPVNSHADSRILRHEVAHCQGWTHGE